MRCYEIWGMLLLSAEVQNPCTPLSHYTCAWQTGNSAVHLLPMIHQQSVKTLVCQMYRAVCQQVVTDWSACQALLQQQTDACHLDL